LPEALARIRREPTLSAPAREATRAPPRTAKAAPPKATPRLMWRSWIPKTAGAYAGMFMAVAALGIVINAVSLQRERHPAPLFAPEAAPAPARPASTAVLPSPAPAPSPASAPRPEAATPPTVKPSVPVPPTSGRKVDPIGELVRTGAASETTKTVLSVQRALVKLGYDLDADGLMGASTVDALHDFEKSHGLPIASELSPRLIAKLNGAAR